MKYGRISLLLLITFFLMNACKNKVDLIVSNATIYIVNENFTIAESFAVRDGRIVEFGSSDEILNKYDAAQIVDATGKFVYPGFNDAHAHFNGYGINLTQYADLRGTTNPEEIYDILKKHYKQFGGEWLLGRSWDQNDWETQEFPDKKKLDELFPEIPVYLVRVDGHAGWCNSMALELAGINIETVVNGGQVVLKNGEPSGILIDNAMGLVAKLIPEITTDQQAKGLMAAQKNCFGVGLTSVTDAGLDKETILLIEKMQNEGRIKMRLNAMINPTRENFDYFLKNGPMQNERLTINTIKIYADGALGSRGALLLEEYSDDNGNLGLQIESQEYYNEIGKLAYENNFAVATHCIGDSANRLMLNTYAKFLKGKNDRRWRIEHAQIVRPDDFAKYADYSIIPSVQATHCTSDMYWADERLGEHRLKGAYAYQTLLQQNGWLPNGTDFPVEDISPIYTFYASVFRMDHKGWPENGWQKEEGLTREQALRSMTVWAAKSSFEEKVKGSLEPGKYADFVILDTDLMNATPQQVLKTNVQSTWIGGEKVFGN